MLWRVKADEVRIRLRIGSRSDQDWIEGGSDEEGMAAEAAWRHSGILFPAPDLSFLSALGVC